MKNKDKFMKDLAIDTGVGVIGASTGLILAGPVGVIISGATTPMLSDVLKRVLSKREKDKIERAAALANKIIFERIKAGDKLTENIKNSKIKELYEGMLLNAKDTYEEDKIPFIANLFATAPFTNTPLDDLVQALILSSQLSFRHFCIISVIGNNQDGNVYQLSNNPFYAEVVKHFKEEATGIYNDIYYLVSMGLIIQGRVGKQTPSPYRNPGLVVPAALNLEYQGNLLFNSMRLFEMDKVYTEAIIKLLK